MEGVLQKLYTSVRLLTLIFCDEGLPIAKKKIAVANLKRLLRSEEDPVPYAGRILPFIKGTVHRFKTGVNGTVSSSVKRFSLSDFHFFDHCDRYGVTEWSTRTVTTLKVNLTTKGNRKKVPF